MLAGGEVGGAASPKEGVAVAPTSQAELGISQAELGISQPELGISRAELSEVDVVVALHACGANPNPNPT